MEYEIDDDPQDSDCISEGQRDGGLIEDHIALRNQSSVQPRDYPSADREDQSVGRAAPRGE